MPRPKHENSQRAESDLDAYSQAIYWRGLFVNRYSAVEYAIAHLIARASLHAHYAHLGEPPYKSATKLKRFRELISMEGPIANYRSELQPSLAVYEDYEAQYRHFMVHAMMVPTDGDFLFQMYDHKDGKFCKGELVFSSQHIETLAKEIGPLSANFTALVSRVCNEIPLPPD